jgi:hypothetical protein
VINLDNTRNKDGTVLRARLNSSQIPWILWLTILLRKASPVDSGRYPGACVGPPIGGRTFDGLKLALTSHFHREHTVSLRWQGWYGEVYGEGFPQWQLPKTSHSYLCCEICLRTMNCGDWGRGTFKVISGLLAKKKLLRNRGRGDGEFEILCLSQVYLFSFRKQISSQ